MYMDSYFVVSYGDTDSTLDIWTRSKFIDSNLSIMSFGYTESRYMDPNVYIIL